MSVTTEPEVRTAIERALRQSRIQVYVRDLLPLFNAVADEPAVVKMMAKAAHNKNVGDNDPKWDTLSDASQQYWTDAISAAVKALAKACKI